MLLPLFIFISKIGEFQFLHIVKWNRFCYFNSISLAIQIVYRCILLCLICILISNNIEYFMCLFPLNPAPQTTICFVGPHLVVIRNYSWLCAQVSSSWCSGHHKWVWEMSQGHSYAQALKSSYYHPRSLIYSL